jgi:hypothetical protein
LFAANFLAYELKRQFGLFAHQVFHLASDAHDAWLGLGSNEIFTLATVIVGLAVYQRTGLPNSPWLERVLYRERAEPKPVRIWRPALLATGLILAIAAALFFVSASLGHSDKLFSTLHGQSIPHATLVKLWTMYPLALFGAPIEEETFFRLGLVSTLVFVLARLAPRADRRGVLLLWVPIVLVGIYFGYVHVAENLETVQTGNIYLSTLIAPQTWAGIVLGYVFCTYGLEAAIAAHFITDLGAPVVLGAASALSHMVH